MLFTIIDKDHAQGILDTSENLGGTKRRLVTFNFVEHEGRDMLLIFPKFGADAYLISDSHPDDVQGGAPGTNVHEHFRQDAILCAQFGVEHDIQR